MIPTHILIMQMYQMDIAERFMCSKVQMYQPQNLMKRLMQLRMEITMHSLHICLSQRQSEMQRMQQVRSSGEKLLG